MRAYLKFKLIFLFSRSGGVIASSIHSIQPKVIWEDGFATKELPRADALWPKLWGILLVTCWCRRAQATVPVPSLSRRSWETKGYGPWGTAPPWSLFWLIIPGSCLVLLPWSSSPIQWSKSCLPDSNKKQTSTGCLKPKPKFFDLSPLYTVSARLLIGFCYVCVGNRIDGNLAVGKSFY